MAGFQKMHDLLQLFILANNSNGVIMVSRYDNLLFSQTKQKKVFIPAQQMQIIILEIINKIMFFIPCSGTAMIDDLGLLLTNCLIGIV
jgi:hypothetical protein